ncbi:hypothetical protein [Bacillus sp. Brlt_9]|uniref:hypothetical protein n=1 Tax=Bacillus sp. Brlt_9 TaxID=3110916 RepID=UPI003F7BAB42
MDFYEYIFQNLDCTITHVKRHNEGGNQFPFIEYVGLYPNWDCNVWEVQLIYKERKRRPFKILTSSEMGKPNLIDILKLIYSKDTRHMTRRQYLDNNEYVEFFKEYGEEFGGKEEVEEIIRGILYGSGFYAAGLLYKMLGKEDFYTLKKLIGVK